MLTTKENVATAHGCGYPASTPTEDGHHENMGKENFTQENSVV